MTRMWISMLNWLCKLTDTIHQVIKLSVIITVYQKVVLLNFVYLVGVIRVQTCDSMILVVALTNKGNVLFKRGDYEKAREFYKEALQNDSSCVESLFNLGNFIINATQVARLKVNLFDLYSN